MNKILKLNLLEKLEIVSKMISVLFPLFFLAFLLFLFNLYLLKKILNIKIKDFMRENQNTPLPLLWMFFSFYTAIILIFGISYAIEYKPIVEFLSEPFVLSMFAGSFVGVPTIFILWSLLKHKKALFIVCIIICLFSLFAYFKLENYRVIVSGGVVMNLGFAISFLMKYLKK